MRNLVFLLLCITAGCLPVKAELYSRAYGDAANPAVIFLHGGPGYNSVSFEYTTAKRLADEGKYYVIVFDQRGCGRSPVDKAKYTFKEAFSDLNGIYKKYNIKKASLIGHSFGGTLGILFAEAYPQKVENLILTGSPLSYQITFRHIIARCRQLYEEQDSPQLPYLALLEKMDTASLEYSSFCFRHAMGAGFYRPEKRTDEAKALSDSLKKSPDASYLSLMTIDPVNGFYEHEKYTTLNLTAPLTKVIGMVHVYGIYGKEDGLFDEHHLALLQALIKPENFTIVEGSSHNVFIDQQAVFLEKIKTFLDKR